MWTVGGGFSCQRRTRWHLTKLLVGFRSVSCFVKILLLLFFAAINLADAAIMIVPPPQPDYEGATRRCNELAVLAQKLAGKAIRVDSIFAIIPAITGKLSDATQQSLVSKFISDSKLVRWDGALQAYCAPTTRMDVARRRQTLDGFNALGSRVKFDGAQWDRFIGQYCYDVAPLPFRVGLEER